MAGRGVNSNGGGCRVSPLIMVVVLSVVVVMGKEHRQVEHHHHHYPSVRRYPHLATFAIMNGTDSVLREGQNGFIYCFANVRVPLRVVWTDPYGRPLPLYKGTQTPDESMGHVFAVGGVFPLPYAFLVFRNFAEGLSGRYECSLLYGHARLAKRTIHLHYFTPSYRVLPLPKCLTVPLGGSVLLPSPVQGRPPRPPAWTLLEGDQDNASVREVKGRLLLRGLKGGTQWSRGQGVRGHEIRGYGEEGHDLGVSGSGVTGLRDQLGLEV